MKRLWAWYRARRWWARILLAIPAVLTSVVLLYVAARGIQYAGAGGDACRYIPEGANFAAGVRDLDGEWERLQETEAWKNLQKKAMKDKSFRAEWNKTLQGAGLPTLDQLDDKRWMEKNPQYQESTILRVAGRDAMVSLRVGDKFETARMMAATKVGFGDYLLLPFAGLAAKFVGAKKEIVANRTCLKIVRGKKEYFIVIDDAYVIVSDDRSLLADGMRKKSKRPAVSRPFWLRAEFDASPALAKWKKKFRGFPTGLVLPFLNAETARAMELEAGVLGSSFLLDVRLDGATVMGGASEFPMTTYAPANSSSYEVHVAGMQDIYAWLKSLIVPDPKATPFDKFVQKQASDAVKELTNGGFEERFVSRVESPMAVLLGSEVGTKERTYTAGALVLTSSDPAAAVGGLQATFQKIMQKWGTFSTEWREGVTLFYFNRASDPFDLNNYLRPCVAAIGNTVVVANNLAFLQRVVDAWAGSAPRFVDLPIQRQARQRMKEAGFEAPSPADVGSGFVVLSTLREGLQGHLPEVATKSVDAATPLTKIRREVEADLQRQGLQLSIDEIDGRTLAERQRRIDAEIEKSERSLKSMEYLRWVAFGVRPKGTAIAIRLMVDVR